MCSASAVELRQGMQGAGKAWVGMAAADNIPCEHKVTRGKCVNGQQGTCTVGLG